MERVTPKTAHRRYPRLPMVTSDVGCPYIKAEAASPVQYISTGNVETYQFLKAVVTVAMSLQIFVLFD